MQTEAIRPTPSAIPRATGFAPSAPWLMLFSRSATFFLVQVLIAAAVLLAGMQNAWTEAARWWPFFAVVANGVSVYLLVRLYRQEGSGYLQAIRFHRETWKTDLLWFIGFSIIAMPIAGLPREPLGRLFFGDPIIPTYMLFQPLPTVALILALLFPLTIGFGELPTYFGYCMPRLAALLKNGWLAWLIASFFLAAQHMFLPLLLDSRYLLWRFFMFVPFALIVGLCLKFRPSLLPYFMIGHALIDITTLSVYLMI